MRIAIDGYEANNSIRVGIGRFAFEILRSLRVMQSDHTFEIYLPAQPRFHMPNASDRWRYYVVYPKQFWTFIGFPLALTVSRPDVVFSPTHYLPRWVGLPRVMAIMDVSYLTYPELFRPADLHKLVHWTRYSVHHAARIITISEFSKNAIIEAYNVRPDRVVVCYPGLTMHQTGKKTLSDRYILSVGTLQPRKNYVRFIEAFSTLTDKTVELVIVGKKGWLFDDILRAPKQFGVEGRVHFLDFVPDADLPGLYKNAACFVLPSLYEGFGLPVLEAMAYGCPVVISNTSSLPEIAGEAGIYVQPEDVSDIARGITQALTEKGNIRTNRIAKGLKRAESFTWDKAAEKVMTVLEEAGRKGTA